MQQVYEKVKLAIALRIARAAIGWSQEELANKLEFAKTTVARAETLDGGLRIDQLSKLLQLYKANGIELDFLLDRDIKVHIQPSAIEQMQTRLLDESQRRTDRRAPLGGLPAVQNDTRYSHGALPQVTGPLGKARLMALQESAGKGTPEPGKKKAKKTI
jgi:transcriptional regulator with XRE-family HTH domain